MLMRVVGELSTLADIVSAGTARRLANKQLTELGAKRKSALRLHEGVTDHLFDTRGELDYNAKYLRN